MDCLQLLTDIETKTTEKETLALRVAEKPNLIPDLIATLTDKRATVRYGCAKILHLLAESHPALLYPHFDSFVTLLHGENSIMQAEGLFVLSHLAAVDKDNRIEPLLADLLQPIRGTVLMVAANAIQGGARIAEAKPHLADQIAAAILEVPAARYKTSECVHVACGAAVESLDLFAHLVSDVRPIRKFFHAQADSPRKGTRTRAEKVLRRRGW